MEEGRWGLTGWWATDRENHWTRPTRVGPEGYFKSSVLISKTPWTQTRGHCTLTPDPPEPPDPPTDIRSGCHSPSRRLDRITNRSSQSVTRCRPVTFTEISITRSLTCGGVSSVLYSTLSDALQRSFTLWPSPPKIKGADSLYDVCGTEGRGGSEVTVVDEKSVKIDLPKWHRGPNFTWYRGLWTGVLTTPFRSWNPSFLPN